MEASQLSMAEKRSTSMRLLLPHPNAWTVNEAQEAENCSGYCTVQYRAGVRVVDSPRPCKAHGGAS